MRKSRIFSCDASDAVRLVCRFAGSGDPVTPVSKEYKQQLMGSPVYIQIFKEERTLDLRPKWVRAIPVPAERLQNLQYSGGLGRNAVRAILKVGRVLQRSAQSTQARQPFL